MDGQVSPLMDSWLAWGYKVCGEQERYAASRAHIEADYAANPGVPSPGYIYILALEGRDADLAEEYAQLIDSRYPMVVFGPIFLIDYVGWGISGKMAQNQRFMELLDSVALPPDS